MVKGSLKSGVIGCALLMLLASCETTTSSDAGTSVSRAEFRDALPEEVYDFAFTASVAELLADECPSTRFDRPAATKQMKSISDGLKAKGYNQSDFRHLSKNLPRKRVQDDLIQYIQKNGLVIGEPSTFCTVARREIASGTAVGALLKG